MAFYSQICISQIRFYLSVSLIYQHIISFLYSLTRKSTKSNKRVIQLNISGISKAICLSRWYFMPFYDQVCISKINSLEIQAFVCFSQ